MKYMLKLCLLSVVFAFSVHSIANDMSFTQCNGINPDTDEGVLFYFDKKMDQQNRLWFGDQVTILDGLDDLESLVTYVVDGLFTQIKDNKLYNVVRLKPEGANIGEGFYIFVTPSFNDRGEMDRLLMVEGTSITGFQLSSYDIACSIQ